MSGSIPPTPAQQTAIDNERTKLTANALNTLAVATVVTGIVVPTVKFVYEPGGTPPWPLLVAISLVWLGAGVGLHLIARAVLGRLR